ncbi:hypothetical protein CapIbe_019877 [Capra ibex]
MASCFQLIGLLGGGRLQAQAPQSRWQVLMAGPSGKHNFTSPAVAGRVACHQGPEWMLGELAASTHGGPLHQPHERHMHRPCDGASHPQHTCSPANVRVLPQSRDPTPLVQGGESEPCSATAGSASVERQNAAGPVCSIEYPGIHHLLLTSHSRQRCKFNTADQGALVSHQARPGTRLQAATRGPAGPARWKRRRSVQQQNSASPRGFLETQAVAAAPAPGGLGTPSTTAAGRAASPGALRAPRTFPVSGLRKPRKARKTHPGEIPDNSSVGSREQPQVESRSEHPEVQAPWKRQHRAKPRAGAVKGAAWSLEAAEGKEGGSGGLGRAKLSDVASLSQLRSSNLHPAPSAGRRGQADARVPRQEGPRPSLDL